MILKHIDKLDDSKFKPLKGRTKDKWKILHDNLWSMFNINDYKQKEDESDKEKFVRKICDIPDELSVTNFSWTKEVEKEFENHPYHKGFTRYHSKDIGWFALNYYPKTI